MRFALFKEVPRRQRRKKRKLNDGGATRKGQDTDGTDDSDDSDEELEPTVERMSMSPQSKSPRGKQAVHDPVWGDDSQDVPMEVEQPGLVPAGPDENGRIRPERCVQ